MPHPTSSDLTQKPSNTCSHVQKPQKTKSDSFIHFTTLINMTVTQSSGKVLVLLLTKLLTFLLTIIFCSSGKEEDNCQEEQLKLLLVDQLGLAIDTSANTPKLRLCIPQPLRLT
jgi:hypothetical protein